MPTAIGPDQEPATPYFDFVPRHMGRMPVSASPARSQQESLTKPALEREHERTDAWQGALSGEVTAR